MKKLFYVIHGFLTITKIMNLFFQFSNDVDIKIYSKREIENMFNEMNFDNVTWKKATKYTYICI